MSLLQKIIIHDHHVEVADMWTNIVVIRHFIIIQNKRKVVIKFELFAQDSTFNSCIQMIEDLVSHMKKVNMEIVRQEIFSEDPETAVRSLKVYMHMSLEN